MFKTWKRLWPLAPGILSLGFALGTHSANAATVPCTPAPSSLSAWYPLDETSGGSAADVVADHDGTHIGGPTPTTGVVDGALSFDGIDDRVEVPDPPSGLDVGTGDFTFDMWIRTTETAGVATILDKRQDPASVLGYSFYLFNGALGLQLADGNGASFCSMNPAGSACTNYNSTAFVADGDWHFAAVVVDRDDPQGIRWYVDGQFTGIPYNPMIRPGSLDSNAPLRIAGHSFGGGGAFAGDLDEVEVFLRALDETDLDAIYDAGGSGKCKPVDYFTVTPCRAVDTRTGLPLQNGVPQTFALHGVCGIPSSATTVVLNATAVAPTGDGDLTIYAGDATAPAFSTLAFPAARTRSLLVFVSLSSDGEVAVQTAVAGNGTVHLLLDVMGYFE
jgi:hypothetical protein